MALTTVQRAPAALAPCIQLEIRGERCQVIAQPASMPSAFFGRYRLMAIDGTVFNTPDTPANAAAFGRSSNQYGKGAYPQARAVFLTECGSHATVGLHLGSYDEAELHGAYALLPQLSRGMLLMHDANFFGGAYLEALNAKGSSGAVRLAEHGSGAAPTQSARWQLPGTAQAQRAGGLSHAQASVGARHRVSAHR